MWKLLIVIALAAVVGVMSANYVVEGHAGLFNRTKGQWVWWPNAGSTAIDPYTRFHFLTRSRLPLSKFETLELEAKADNAGRPLNSDCVYLLSGRLPDARWWSLASYDAASEPDVSNTSNALGSHDVLFEPDGTLNVIISRDIQAGNWIKPSGDDEFTLLLRIYNPVNNFGSGTILSGDLPFVTRRVCR